MLRSRFVAQREFDERRDKLVNLIFEVNVSVETLAPCKKLIRVEFAVEEVREAFGRITRQFQKHVNLPGFRSGKAPKHLVARSYGESIEEEVKKELIGVGCRKAVDENGLRLVGEWDVEEVRFSKDSPFQFVVRTETAPDFELPKYKGLKAKREMRTVTEDDVERAVQVLREDRASFLDVDREAKEDDFLVVNYQGTCEGKPITELAPTAERFESAKDFWIHLAENRFIPGFAEQLNGAKKGEHRSVKIDFAADFAIAELAGKTGVFEVDVVEVKERMLPDLSDEFARRYGAESMAALRAGVIRDLEAELKAKVNRDVKNQLLQALMTQVTCELPESIVDEETKSLVYSIVHDSRKRGVSKESIDERKEEIYLTAARSAKSRVKSAFVLGKIAEAENIEASDQEVRKQIVELSRMYNISPEKMNKQLEDQNKISEVREQIIRSKVLDLLEEHADVEAVLPIE